MGKAPFGRVCNILGIYDTPAPATSELAHAQSAATIPFKQNLKPVRQLRARAQDLAGEARRACVRSCIIAW
eukprot:COSAG05_NODE_2127_length_3517_cov_17.700995_4_plen_71_part_00